MERGYNPPPPNFMEVHAFCVCLIMMGASTARRDVDMSTKELAKCVLSEVHTAELSGSERGRHILYGHSSKISKHTQHLSLIHI